LRLRSNVLDKLIEFFLQFIDKKFHKFRLYAHNLSSFDGILIMEAFFHMSEQHGFRLEPIIKDNKIISLKIRFGKTSGNKYRYYIEFHDSLLLLLGSLDKLSKTFLHDHNDLHKINDQRIKDLLLYKESRNKNNLQESLKDILLYCERDSLCLAVIIEKFAELIYDLYKLNIHKYPTASSLSMAIYQSNFLESEDLIPLISGDIYKDIKKAYHGGHTEVYKLYSDKPVYSYDYVSMYPSQMINQYMPVGKINKFIGNPLLNGETLETLKDKLAFIKCTIYVGKSKKKRPVYQTLVNINGELRSVCATGTFLNQMVYVPELLKYQEITNGLTRIIPESIEMGYLFEKKIIFKDFIEYLFNLKNSVDKNNPLYQIAKILMNSLYGRMGLKQELTEYKFMDKVEVEKFSMNENVTIKDIIEFNNLLKSLVITEKYSDEVTLKSSVPIAAAITAHARMYMAPLLLDEELDILYIDTDSFKCTQKITELERYKHLGHNGLGGLKYEYTFKEFIALGPKVYGGILHDDNSEIVKIKGFKNKIEFDDLKKLLLGNKELKLSQHKWRRDLFKSDIKIMKSPYNLVLTNNKRISDLKTLETNNYHFDCYDPEAVELELLKKSLERLYQRI